jgi:formylglycine-generating enzyme required for sulfatase activity
VKGLAQFKDRLAALDWHWLSAVGLALGFGGGLAGLLGLESAWWLPVWGALLAGLTWLGWDAEPELGAPLVAKPAPKAVGPRLVREGPFEMVELPGGESLMGSPDGDDMASDDERPQHRVRVSGFRIARIPVNTQLYREVMTGGGEKGGDDLPVTNASWYDAVEFCNRLSERYGYRPCYRRRGLWPWRGWHCDWRADGYRLPTEAEWEYACRAGTRTRYSFGADPARLPEFAWYEANSGGRSHPVGTKRASPWGLFDMQGNVWEWCWDKYGAYGAAEQVDPRGPSRGHSRVLRGGSFEHSPAVLRSAGRGIIGPESRNWNVGFRCVRVASPQP